MLALATLRVLTFRPPLHTTQGRFGYNITEQDEDCLFVNIYSPIGASLAYPIDALNSEAAPTAQRQRSAAALAPLLPVTVFFHGGGYVAGSGTQPLYNGSAFCNTSNTVLVTVNYRLGVMGFLSLPGLAKGGSSGNYGLLDQQVCGCVCAGGGEGGGGRLGLTSPLCGRRSCTPCTHCRQRSSLWLQSSRPLVVMPRV